MTTTDPSQTASSAERPGLDAKAHRRARTIVITIACGIVVFSLVPWLAGPETKDYVRTAIAGILAWGLLRGSSLARWTVGVLCALAGAIGIVGTVELFSGTAFHPLLLVVPAMVVFYLASALLLLTGKLVLPFFEPRIASEAASLDDTR